ncbi:MAG: hypothetical protein AB7O73_12165 [Bacteroidia bacterium]
MVKLQPKQYHTAKPFHSKLVKYREEYQEYLLLEKSDGTAVSHSDIIHAFINYLFGYHLVASFDQITVAMVNSGFQAHYKSQYKENVSKESMKKILKGFFVFVYGKYGIKNERVMRGLER